MVQSFGVSFRRFENSRNVEVPPGTNTSTSHEHGTQGLWIRPSRTVFFQDNFFSKLSTIRQQSPSESAYANSLKGCESIETVLSLTLKDGQNPCQESAISLKCLKFYGGDNYGLGEGRPRITSTSTAVSANPDRARLFVFIQLPF